MFEALTTAERKQAVEACEIIKTLGRASTSSIQRRLRIGYTAAARLMDCLEDEGIVGTPDHEYQRPIYADKLEEGLSANAPRQTAERSGASLHADVGQSGS